MRILPISNYQTQNQNNQKQNINFGIQYGSKFWSRLDELPDTNIRNLVKVLKQKDYKMSKFKINLLRSGIKPKVNCEELAGRIFNASISHSEAGKIIYCKSGTYNAQNVIDWLEENLKMPERALLEKIQLTQKSKIKASEVASVDKEEVIKTKLFDLC